MPTITEAILTTHEQATEVISVAAPTPDQRIDNTVSPEMPSSHPEVNAATISIDGLVKNCPHFAKMHEEDPERATAEANQIVQEVKEDSALRQQGMSDKEIRAKRLADNLARAKEKAEVLAREEKAETRQKPEFKVEVVQGTKPAKPESEQTRYPTRERAPSEPKLVGEHREALRAIQQDRQQDKPLSVVLAAPVETQGGSVRDEKHLEPQRTDAFVHYKQHTVSQEQPPVDTADNEQLSDLRLITAPVQEFVSEVSAAVYENEIQDTAQQAIDIVDAEAKVNPQEAIFDFGETTQDDEPEIDTLALPLAETTETDSIEAPVEQNAVTDEQLVLQFEAEVIDTYKKLLVILEDEISEPHEPNESATELESETGAVVVETVPLETTTQDFETFLAVQPEADEVVTLETIIEQADEQPLEQTLVQLAQHLSDTLVESQDASETPVAALPELNNEHIELNAILQEIAEILPTCYSVNEETQEKRIQITPEMTQKLLMLLRSLGYEQPREVLVEFVRLHSLSFLLQAIQYMCQLNNEENRQEFYAQPSTYVPSDDGNARLRLGKVLFSLVARQVSLRSEPELLVASL